MGKGYGSVCTSPFLAVAAAQAKAAGAAPPPLAGSARAGTAPRTATAAAVLEPRCSAASSVATTCAGQQTLLTGRELAGLSFGACQVLFGFCGHHHWVLKHPPCLPPVHYQLLCRR